MPRASWAASSGTGVETSTITLSPGDGSAIYDSDYAEVGQWRIVAAPEA